MKWILEAVTPNRKYQLSPRSSSVRHERQAQKRRAQRFPVSIRWWRGPAQIHTKRRTVTRDWTSTRVSETNACTQWNSQGQPYTRNFQAKSRAVPTVSNKNAGATSISLSTVCFHCLHLQHAVLLWATEYRRTRIFLSVISRGLQASINSNKCLLCVYQQISTTEMMT